ncbi:hypothetical protein [Fodinicola acaciae]|uniref:hypothetical protein n=1 Tax=Fodinicola acaciae TaxID=2681555 RepID=UPI0013D287F2|nr:hypothetical protein [Fodinicola acaciae]
MTYSKRQPLGWILDAAAAFLLGLLVFDVILKCPARPYAVILVAAALIGRPLVARWMVHSRERSVAQRIAERMQAADDRYEHAFLLVSRATACNSEFAREVRVVKTLAASLIEDVQCDRDARSSEHVFDLIAAQQADMITQLEALLRQMPPTEPIRRRESNNRMKASFSRRTTF